MHRIRKNIGDVVKQVGAPTHKKEPVIYIPDIKGKLEKLGKRVIKEDKEFKSLGWVNINYCYRRPARFDKDGFLVAGQARRMPVQARDLFKVDFVIEMARDVWKHLSKEARHRLMWHELRHCQVVLDEASQPERDRHGRVKIKLDSHDLVVKTFREEVRKFGTAGHEKAIAKFLRKQAKAKADELNDA